MGKEEGEAGEGEAGEGEEEEAGEEEEEEAGEEEKEAGEEEVGEGEEKWEEEGEEGEMAGVLVVRPRWRSMAWVAARASWGVRVVWRRTAALR